MTALLGLPASSPLPLTATSSNPSNSSIRIPSKFLVKTPNQWPWHHLKFQKSRYNFTRFLVFAVENDNGSNGENIDDLLSDDEKKQRSTEENGLNGNGNGDGDDINGNGGEKGRPRLNLNWIDLLINPDPDNVVAVGLTGVLAWASVQVLWQLFVISIAIILAALKYSFIAALLIFILIALL